MITSEEDKKKTGDRRQATGFGPSPKDKKIKGAPCLMKHEEKEEESREKRGKR